MHRHSKADDFEAHDLDILAQLQKFNGRHEPSFHQAHLPCLCIPVVSSLPQVSLLIRMLNLRDFYELLGLYEPFYHSSGASTLYEQPYDGYSRTFPLRFYERWTFSNLSL